MKRRSSALASAKLADQLSSTSSPYRILLDVDGAPRFRLKGQATVIIGGKRVVQPTTNEDNHSDFPNYILLVALYTLQGIPMGLSASIPFLIQQKLRAMAALPGASSLAHAATAGSVGSAAAAARLSYQANAVFALCTWPFSLKLLWAPLVDACFIKALGRRKSWLVPVQTLAGLLMVLGAGFVERQLGLGHTGGSTTTTTTNLALSQFNVKGVTAFFFVLYFLMATQDIAVDGWALTMLSKKNRGRGPVCNSCGQNIGYFLSFVGFLALHDAESSEQLWRPLFGLPSNPGTGLVSLGAFIRFMGFFMLATTAIVALLKREDAPLTTRVRDADRLSPESEALLDIDRMRKDDDEDHELDSSEIGLKETYRRLWAVCQLPAVRWLFFILLTYRLPTAVSDNVKFLKAVEFGLSKSTTALLSPTIILPLGILVPIVASKVWHGHPLRQFMTAYKLRVTLVPLLDTLMLFALQRGTSGRSKLGLAAFWFVMVASTASQAIVNSLQFNAQMTFFAHRVDPTIGGSYMTLLNTAANLGGTWPASLTLWLVGVLTRDPVCRTIVETGEEICTEGWDPFYAMQAGYAVLGCLWIAVFGRLVRRVADLPEDSWRTIDNKSGAGEYDVEDLGRHQVELPNGNINPTRWWERKDSKSE